MKKKKKKTGTFVLLTILNEILTIIEAGLPAKEKSKMKIDRDYRKFDIDADLPGSFAKRVYLVIDAILDGGYDISDRESLANIIAQDMQISYYRGLSDGISKSSREWSMMVKRMGEKA
jgi:hypothetical protein